MQTAHMNRTNIAMLAFLLIALAYLIFTAMARDIFTITLKPFLLPPLIAATFISGFIRRWYLILALIFCWVGDVLLLFADRGAAFFIGGLSAFLVGHVFYILLFAKLMGRYHTGSRLRLPVLVGLAAYMLAFYLIVGQSLGAMLFPVMLYAVVISTMLYLAIILAGRMEDKPSFFLIGGAVAFVISDTILAVNKFYTPVPYAGLFIMSTYIFAQGALVWALLNQTFYTQLAAARPVVN